jgi:uncharacterized protein with HEPN domain
MLDEANFIVEKSSNLLYKEFLKDTTLQRAVCRSLDIIGLVSDKVSQNFKEERKQIKWKELSGFKDKLTNGFFGINQERLWDIIENFLPDVKNEVEKIINEVDKGLSLEL